MLLLGLLPGYFLDRIAAFGRSFFQGAVPSHAVDYFSVVNLKGAAISLTIGLVVYLLVVRTLLMPKGESGRRYYRDPIPGWLNLEYGLYRPLLKFSTQVLLLAAAFVDRVGFRLLFRGLPALFLRWSRWLIDRRSRLVSALTGQEYTPRPSLEQVVDDSSFGLYDDQPQRGNGVMRSLAFGLILTGLGLVFSILFIFLHR